MVQFRNDRPCPPGEHNSLPGPGGRHGNRFRVLVLAENDAIRAGLLGLLSDDAQADIFYPKTESDVVDLLRQSGEAVVLQSESPAGDARDKTQASSASGLDWGASVGRLVMVEGVRLTKLQARVLRMVVSGTSNKEMAASLLKTVPSIKRTIQHLFAKFGVRTRAQLAVIGARAEASASRAGGFNPTES